MRKRKYESDDKVLVISDEKVQILDIQNKNETSITTDWHVFPVADTKALINPDGGIYYVINCSLKYLQECEHLKDLSENIAIKNMFNFGEKSTNIQFYVMLAVLVITIFLLRG